MRILWWLLLLLVLVVSSSRCVAFAAAAGKEEEEDEVVEESLTEHEQSLVAKCNAPFGETLDESVTSMDFLVVGDIGGKKKAINSYLYLYLYLFIIKSIIEPY
jgi:hypothetical protein